MKPVIGDEAAMQLREEYLQMRSQGAKAAMENVVTATPRLASTVTVEDVKEAARLINVATQRVGDACEGEG